MIENKSESELTSLLSFSDIEKLRSQYLQRKENYKLEINIDEKKKSINSYSFLDIEEIDSPERIE